MGPIADLAAQVYREYITDGVPASGVHKPRKDEIRSIFDAVEGALSVLTLGGVAGVTKATRALLSADLAHDADTVALVYADPTDSFNDFYIKTGASGAGAWTPTTILQDAISGAAQPFVAAAEIAADEAQAAAAAVTNGQRVQERLTQQAALTGGVPRGFLDLADIGIADYPNDYGVLFYGDGVRAWPMIELSAARPEWIDGGIVVRNPADGKLYVSISVAKRDDPTRQGAAVNIRFVSYAAGDDAAAGSEGAPWKRTAYAVANAPEPFLILVAQDFVGSDSTFGLSALTRSGRVLGVPPTADKTWWLQVRESDTLAARNWTDNGDGSFSSNAPGIANSVKNAPGHVDLGLLDADGAPTFMAFAASKAAARATKNSVFCDTTVSPYEVTVHRFDGLAPNPGVNYAYTEVQSALQLYATDGKTVVFENFNWIRNDGGSASAGVFARAAAVTVPGPRVEHTGHVWFYECGMFGSSGNGFGFYDIARGGAENCVIKGCRDDAVNGHTYYTYGNVNVGDRTLEGRHLHLWAWNLICENFGAQGFKDQPALAGSSQVVTTHDQVRLTFGNVVGGIANGAPCAVVNGGYAFGVGSFIHDPTHAAGGAVPKAAFWVDGTSDAGVIAKLRLAYCASRVASTGKTFAATNGGLLSHYQQKGAKTVLAGQTGTVTDLG